MKKASLTAKQMIWIITIVLTFLFVVILLVRVNPGEQSAKNACHASVILRGTASAITGKVGEYIPLQCQTERYCITARNILEGGGKCPSFQGESIINIRVKNTQDIERFIAKEIVSCWSIMGEGKISLFSQYIAQTYGIGSVFPTCVICSRIGYDYESFTKKKIDFNKVNVLNYMATHQMPDKNQSYTDYLAGENAKYSTSSKISSLVWDEEKGLLVDTGEQQDVPTTDYSQDPNIREKEIAILFMQITSPKHGETALNVGKRALETAYASYVNAPKSTMQVGKYIGKLCTSGGWVGPVVCGAILVVAGIYQQANVGYNRAVTASKCGDVVSEDQAREGCSVVRTIDYSSEDLSQYCEVVEGGHDLSFLNGE